jgi:uncharacterized protein (DUF2147 family)
MRYTLRRHLIVGVATCLTVAGVRGASAQASAVGTPASAVGTPPSAVGTWNTISDKDGKPEAVVEIREVNGELVGTVTALLVEADPADSVCGKCSGDRQGQRIVGMEIVRRMKPDGDEWSGGEILDPETGKTYKAKMKLADGGKRLVLRGFIGISLFGRSQTWVRRE